eukprot:1805987-Rhodomonas_salina.1
MELQPETTQARARFAVHVPHPTASAPATLFPLASPSPLRSESQAARLRHQLEGERACARQSRFPACQ